MATETTLATAAGHDRRQAAISRTARHLYDAETALHNARQSGAAPGTAPPPAYRGTRLPPEVTSRSCEHGEKLR